MPPSLALSPARARRRASSAGGHERWRVRAFGCVAVGVVAGWLGPGAIAWASPGAGHGGAGAHVLAARGARPGAWIACVGAELWRASAGEPTFERVPLELATPDPRDGGGCAALQLGFVSDDELWIEGPGGAVLLQREQWVVAADALAERPALRPLRTACADASAARTGTVTIWPVAHAGAVVLAPVTCTGPTSCPPPPPRMRARASGVLALLDVGAGAWRWTTAGARGTGANAASPAPRRGLGQGWDVGIALTLGFSPLRLRSRAVELELTQQQARNAAREALRCGAR